MYKYIIKRLILMIPVIIGISFMVFTIMNLSPGTPADIILGSDVPLEAVHKLNEELGYYEPFMVKYVTYVKDALHGDFGSSYRTGLSVFEEIASRFPTTIKLAVFSISLAIIFGIPIGVLSAVKQYSLIDSFSTMIALVFMSIPTFWLGLMLIMFFSLKLGLFPTFGSDTIVHFILPSVATCASTLATLIRLTRSTMLEVIRQDYIRTAYAKGANLRRVIFRHAIKNALIPVITAVGLSFGYLLGGAIITESVFSMSGVGSLLLGAIRSKDVPVVMGSALMLAIAFSMINLLVDIIYAFVDPRIKAQYKG